MIYWFTGQPAAGKTTLGDLLKIHLEEKRNDKDPNNRYKIYRVDGDDMRQLFSNKDYSIKGRVNNISTAQRISHYLHNQGYDVIVSLVSPYLDQREEFKSLLGENIKEIYVYTSEIREREIWKHPGYVAPVKNFIDIDTTIDTPSKSLKKILNEI